MIEKNVPINKGNYSMDTDERNNLFEKYCAEGWEDEYKDYRGKWNLLPKKRIINEYPLNVDMELSTVCNLKCPMCYTITDEFRNNVECKFMDFSLFKKVIDEIGGKVPALRLSLRGESTLHPNFIECIKYAKDAGIGEVSTLTNGSMLTEKFFERMLLAGIDWITVSIDGVGDDYEKIRKPLKFDDMLNKLKKCKEIKQKYNVHKPLIKIQTIWPAIQADPEMYYNIFEPYVDLIAFNPLIEYDYDESKIEYINNFSCPQIYQRLIVTSNGKVIPCCIETTGKVILGDANKDSIYDIWHGMDFNRFRDLFLDDSYRNLPGCKKCILSMKTYENEKAKVNDREFFVKNYRK